ncbi:hypothetical protein [Micromonospora peucetia]|uniref:hypothetical protein n=1 Tax=Micromonospora peucetia TaxID=47871 RepID=UPI00316AE4BE
MFALALLRWRPKRPDCDDLPERFTAAPHAGGRYVRYSPVVRRILLPADPATDLVG